jgi:hypothetical protein
MRRFPGYRQFIKTSIYETIQLFFLKGRFQLRISYFFFLKGYFQLRFSCFF